jgi:hypothetical protein
MSERTMLDVAGEWVRECGNGDCSLAAADMTDDEMSRGYCEECDSASGDLLRAIPADVREQMREARQSLRMLLECCDVDDCGECADRTEARAILARTEWAE